MKIAAKLVSVAILGIVLLSTINGFIRVRREIGVFDADMRRDAFQMARTARDLVVEVWRQSGRVRALELLDGISNREHGLQMKFVWLDVQDDAAHTPAVPLDRLTQARRGEELSLEDSDWKREGRVLTYVPIEVEPGRPAALELTESLEGLHSYTRATIRRVVTLTIVTVLVSGAGVLLLGVGVIGKPLHRLIEKTRAIGSGDLTVRLDANAHDELGELARAFNQMCAELEAAQESVRAETEARIKALEQLRHADRLKTVGRLASGIAHELGTPLNVVAGRAALIVSGKLSADDITDSAVTIRKQAERMTRLIRQLLDFARRRNPKREHVEIAPVVAEVLTLLKPQANKRGVTLELADTPAPLAVLLDTGQVQQLFTNLLMNAIQAMPDGGRVAISMKTEHKTPPAGVEAPTQDYVRVDVSDEGTGIAEENLPYLFEPFFTTKDVGEGTGLGLPIAHGIAAEHGGWIEVTSVIRQGSCFSVYLPLSES